MESHCNCNSSRSKHATATCATIQGRPLCCDEGSRPPTPWATSSRSPFGLGDPLVEAATAVGDLGSQLAGVATSILGRNCHRDTLMVTRS
ncbi:hypothetical protein NL676_031646 [Syzygium grande]|nr:hypothetical protein NL676_031646 [Syzygium grande]